MISDDERREVAERLRDKKAECEERGYPWMCDDLILAIGYDHDYEAGDEIFDRLADLIEPSDHIGDPDKMVDRDALLALADEMEQETGSVCGVCMGKTARRIREACGEEGA